MSVGPGSRPTKTFEANKDTGSGGTVFLGAWYDEAFFDERRDARLGRMHTVIYEKLGITLELAPGPLAALGFAVVAGRVGPRIGMGVTGASVGCWSPPEWPTTPPGWDPPPTMPGSICRASSSSVPEWGWPSRPSPRWPWQRYNQRGSPPPSASRPCSRRSVRHWGWPPSWRWWVRRAAANAPDAYRNGWIFMAVAAGIGALPMLTVRFAPAPVHTPEPSATPVAAPPAAPAHGTVSASWHGDGCSGNSVEEREQGIG